MSDTINISRENDGVATITMARPDVHNAFNADMIAALTEALLELGADDSVRTIVLAGEGKSFSAGADLNWMSAMVEASEEDNRQDSLKLARLMRTLDFSPKPTIARVHGSAFGGGVGLVACCDIAIASDNAKFGLTEGKLGLIPAVISPYVIRRIGVGRARRYFLNAEIFEAERAEHMGLVSEVVADEQLDETVAQQARFIAKCGPLSVRHSKQLIGIIEGNSLEKQQQLDEATADLIAKIRVSPEGQEGMRAFLDKRKPSWVSQSH